MDDDDGREVNDPSIYIESLVGFIYDSTFNTPEPVSRT